MSSIHPARGDRRTIRIVDDDPLVLRGLRRVLGKRGWDVLEAASAEPAESILAQPHAQIDLLLTDVVLPVGNGCALPASALARRTGLRVLYMSSYRPEVLDRHGLTGAADAFVRKPFEPDALRARICETLARETAEP